MSPCDLSPILLYGVNSANDANSANVLMVPMEQMVPMC